MLLLRKVPALAHWLSTPTTKGNVADPEEESPSRPESCVSGNCNYRTAAAVCAESIRSSSSLSEQISEFAKLLEEPQV